GLSRAECLQLALLMPNARIVEALDRLIDDGRLTIPATEIRTVQSPYISGGWYNVACECSRHGVRVVPRSASWSILWLKRLLLDVYSDSKEDLDWIVRDVPGISFSQRLSQYIVDTDPRSVLSQAIFDRPSNIRRAFEGLRFGHFTFPRSSAEEER